MANVYPENTAILNSYLIHFTDCLAGKTGTESMKTKWKKWKNELNRPWDGYNGIFWNADQKTDHCSLLKDE